MSFFSNCVTVFYNLILEVIYHHFCHNPFLRSPRSIPTQEEQDCTGTRIAGAETTESHFRSSQLQLYRGRVSPLTFLIFPGVSSWLTAKYEVLGLPWWRSGWESACQCRGHGFEPWSGKIPHAVEQLSP